ncbi:MAG: DUF6502 family protein [Steroidobacteraceae bacterium]
MFLRAVGLLLEPLIRLLLSSGVSWKEFADLAKAKYVEIATEEYGKGGRPTNVSRVAILTGLDRRDVRKLRAQPVSAPEDARSYTSKATQVLSAWFHDRQFLGDDGQPLPLPREGAASDEGDAPSFALLVRRYAPALPPVAIAKELLAAAAIEELADGRLRALQRYYVPQQLDAAKIRLFGSIASDFLATLEHNLSQVPPAAPRFERRAISVRVHPRALPQFRELLQRAGQEFLVRMDDWLTAHEVPPGAPAIRVGVGLYQIEDRKPARASR